MRAQAEIADRTPPLPAGGHLGLCAWGGEDPLTDWPSLLGPVIERLRRLAGTSEKEFLLIGEQMQGVHQNALEVAQLANQLVEAASGQNLEILSARLRQMASDLESYLARFQARNTQSYATLQAVQEYLGQLDGPLAGVQKMTKAFYMLEVSIKIESARLGTMGEGFVTLAMDIKNLSQQVNDKLGAIKEHRGSVLTMVSKNLGVIKQFGSAQEEDARLTMKSALASLRELGSAHERFSQLGGTIALIFQDISGCIGEVVSSLQFHDINRQQLEHIIAALEQLTADILAARATGLDADSHHPLVVEAGDVCELQEAQLHFASKELYAAVSTIIDSLRAVASQQATIQREAKAAAGAMDETGTSFIDTISRGMSTATTLLNTCASSHQEVSRTMAEMVTAIGTSTSFVNDIDGIGYNVVQTALNAQIRAGQAGRQGVVLAALAEEIRTLADTASGHTGAIAGTLAEVNAATTKLINETSHEETSLAAWLQAVDTETQEIMALLGEMKDQLSALVSRIQDKVRTLAAEVEKITACIDIHERSKTVVEEALRVLGVVIAHSRALVPANSAFKERLRQMNEHYTMASERQVHQAVASRHGVALEVAGQFPVAAGSADESAFGDNVDLF